MVINNLLLITNIPSLVINNLLLGTNNSLLVTNNLLFANKKHRFFQKLQTKRLKYLCNKAPNERAN
ncbi:MAG: hypothetical protein D3908_07280 [Candidatus Electrothrix sp. AUS4]|nr:hypothetical protein [Candidatus Electrothrix sp. AUS4]